ncbi:hypothetical protein U1Q18_039961 [Sarracenia purpurea var. burkii]
MLRRHRTWPSIPLKTNGEGSIGTSRAGCMGATAVETRRTAQGRDGTLATNRCITITSTYQNNDENSSKFFVSDVEITRSDIYNDGRIVIHALHGFVSHLSPVSCNNERMTSLSFPISPPMASHGTVEQWRRQWSNGRRSAEVRDNRERR